MKHKRIAVVAAVVLIAAIAVACSGDVGSTGATIAIDPVDFSSRVNNPFFPLIPGLLFTLERTNDAGTVSVTGEVLAETEVVMGVECVAVSEKVFLDGQVLEENRDWYAQDSLGNVWHFGRAVEKYEGAEVVSTAGSWRAGVDGALPGVIMKPDPQVGDVYVQRYSNGEAEDRAEVLALDATVEVPYGTFTDVLRIKEWTPLEPGVATEHYYVKDLGQVLVEQVEGGTASEKLVSELFP